MNQLRRFCTSTYQAILLTMFTLAAFGQTVYVSTTGTETNPALATSWSNALLPTAFPMALTAATSGAIFYVAAGLYTPTGTPATPDRSASFSIASGVEVYGGYAGNGTPGPRVVFPSSTTLSGEIGDPASTTDNSYHVVQFRNASSSTRLDGVVITGGRASGFTPDNSGGGVYNDGSGSGNQSHPLLTNVIFSRNYADFFGGAMLNKGSLGGISNPVLTNVSFSQNDALGFGGAMFNEGVLDGNSNPVLTNVSFSRNSAERGGAVFNGGAYGNSNPVLTNVSFSQNNASIAGGAIFSEGNSNPVLTNGVVFGNADTFFNLAGANLTASYSLFDGGSFLSGPGNLSTTTSPFWDANAGNLQLRSGAEAIDTGNNAAYTGPPTDLAGNPRMVGCRIDMGAYESPNAVQFAPNPSVFTQSTPNGFSVQLSGGVQYERLRVVDRINGYEIRQTEINSTGYFLIPQPGPYSITVIGANGCRAVVTGVAP